jgi:quercetin dioxygenase-like cupin family protein
MTPFQPIADGVEMRVLRLHGGGAGMTFLIRMRKHAVAPLHDHPGGEETFMLEGTLRIRNRTSAARTREPDLVLQRGDHAFVAAGEAHDGIAEEDALFLVVAPGGVTRAPAIG